MNNSLKLTALTLGMAFAASSMAADLTVVSFGGANKNAQVKAFYSPWEAAGHGKVIAGEYNGEMARIQVMADTGNVDWDVVQIEGPDLMRGCDEGIYEHLDWQRLGHAAELIPEAAQDCGSAALVWSVILVTSFLMILGLARAGSALFWKPVVLI